MNKQEAYKILELSPNSSLEDVKKQYKKLAKTLHPDVNKASDAESKFKQINEAFEFIKSGKSDKPEFSPFQHVTFQEPENIFISTTISFKESVLGAKKDIKYNRTIKCSHCNGEGQIPQNNGCSTCDGKGRLIQKRGQAVFVQICPACRGQTPFSDCSKCSSNGSLSSETSVSVNIPPGIQNLNTLRLSDMGNYFHGFLGMEQYSDAFLQVQVTPDPSLHIENNQVVSNISISLLDALKGISTTTPTIDGPKSITIPPLSKNNDQISIPKLGVARQFPHIVKIQVTYPNNTQELISFLEK